MSLYLGHCVTFSPLIPLSELWNCAEDVDLIPVEMIGEPRTIFIGLSLGENFFEESEISFEPDSIKTSQTVILQRFYQQKIATLVYQRVRKFEQELLSRALLSQVSIAPASLIEVN